MRSKPIIAHLGLGARPGGAAVSGAARLAAIDNSRRMFDHNAEHCARNVCGAKERKAALRGGGGRVAETGANAHPIEWMKASARVSL
jgi:hypothetical protein